ncbi:hypothetical protein Tco_0837056 [Tanacetum coccineum]
MTNNNELQNAKEVIDDLNRKVYYAEIEAKEHLERELASAREYDTCINVDMIHDLHIREENISVHMF